MSYQDILTADRRYLILKALSASASYTAHSLLLLKFVDGLGQKPSMDQINGDIQWLHDQGLLTATPSGIADQIATITSRGLDVAEGRSIYPGVRRPSPGEL